MVRRRSQTVYDRELPGCHIVYGETLHNPKISRFAIFAECPILYKAIQFIITGLPDVMTYVISALSSNMFVVPLATASKLILYTKLFEELKVIMLHVLFVFNKLLLFLL